jgi:glycosyltransferase involved in cell wall biosynthesis
VKILHIIGMAHGGAGQHVLSLATGCNPRRFESTVVMAAHNPMRSQFERAGVRVLPLETKHGGKLRRNITSFHQLSDLLRCESFDVINTHTMAPSIAGRIAARRHTRAPVVHMLHAFAGQRFRFGLSRKAAVLIERRLDRVTDWYIAGSQAMIDHGVSQRIFRTDKVVLIPNGVDLRTFDREDTHAFPAESPRSGNEQGRVTVGFLGRLESQKGVRDLIRAAALVRQRNPSIQFRIAGDGALREELETLTAHLQVTDVVKFVGWQRDRIKFLKEIDFLAMPSIWEAFGLSAAEAMTLERPVIASRVEGLPEVIGETGILVPPANSEALAGAILELAANPARRQALGKQARARVEQFFTLDRMIARHEEFYERVGSGGAAMPFDDNQLAPELADLPVSIAHESHRPLSELVNIAVSGKG